MSDELYIKPAKPGSLRDPETLQKIPDDGAYVPANSYWLRRLRDGDAVEAQAPQKKAPKKDGVKP